MSFGDWPGKPQGGGFVVSAGLLWGTYEESAGILLDSVICNKIKLLPMNRITGTVLYCILSRMLCTTH